MLSSFFYIYEWIADADAAAVATAVQCVQLIVYIPVGYCCLYFKMNEELKKNSRFVSFFFWYGYSSSSSSIIIAYYSGGFHFGRRRRCRCRLHRCEMHPQFHFGYLLLFFLILLVVSNVKWCDFYEIQQNKQTNKPTVFPVFFP